MTPRSICSKLPPLAIALIAAATVALLPQRASADDRDAIERGRTAGRGVLLMRDPRACGIALLHARCLVDVDAFLQRHGRADSDYKTVPHIGAHPATGLRAFVTDGDREAMDFALDWFNNVQSTEQMWKEDARAAALFDAGVEDVLLPAARGAPILETLAMGGPVGDLADRSARIPAGTFAVDIGPIRGGATLDSKPGVVGGIAYQRHARLPPGGRKFAYDLVAAVDAALPPPPFATPAYADGPAGDAALGIAAATVRELSDAPGFWLVQADVQRFIDDYVARLRVVAPERARDADDVRVKLRGAAGVDFAELQAAQTRLLGAVFGPPTDRATRAATAFAAAQIPYNAMIVRDAKTAAALLGAVASSDALDAIPGFASARAEAKALAPSDWAAQYKLGLRLVEILTKGGSN
ncbi:MAG TPA: hypothetical protein VGC72_17435 [Candidatus Elarobacter sp.]